LARLSRRRAKSFLDPVHSAAIRQAMKSVRDACELQPNALSIKLSDQIEQLWGKDVSSDHRASNQ
jgi:hypothetical protein